MPLHNNNNKKKQDTKLNSVTYEVCHVVFSPTSRDVYFKAMEKQRNENKKLFHEVN